MCGRFTMAKPEEMAKHYPHGEWFDLKPVPRFNIAPTDPIIAMRTSSTGEQRLQTMRWGYRPTFMLKNPKAPLAINAKAENLVQSAMWRPALEARRCLILADGFYEWRTVPGSKTKQPMYIRLHDGKPFAFAGLYVFDSDRNPSCAIITTTPNDLMAPIHDRMPVILPPDAEETWLDTHISDTAFLSSLLEPYPVEEMEAHPVVPLVGNVRNDGPELLTAPD